MFAVSVTAKIALNFSQTKWLVRPVEHGGPNTIFFVRSAVAELPPRERQCVGRYRHHSFWFLAAAVSTEKNILAILYQRREESTNLPWLSLPHSIFKLLSWNSNSVLATAFHIPPAYFQQKLRSSRPQSLRRT